MRVLQYSTYFSPPSQTFIYDLVVELQRQGVEVHVATFHRVNAETRSFPNVHVVPMPSRLHVSRLWRRANAALGRGDASTSAWPIQRSRLAGVIGSIQPDVIHAQFGNAGTLIAPVAAQYGVPLLVTFHGYDITRLPQQDVWKRRYAELFDKATLLIGVSSHVCECLISLGASPDKVKLLHGGVRTDWFSYSDPAARFDGTQVCCLHVGRLVEKKGPLELIEAFHQAVRATEGQLELHLTVVGDGGLRDKMLNRIHELGLDECVMYMGEVPHQEVVQLMQRSHIYVQHCKTGPDGDQEGQGITFVEASAVGLPIVTTRHVGIRDVVRHGESALLVSEGDVRAMGQSIAFLSQHPHLWTQLGQAGHALVQDNFRLDQQSRELIRLYEQVSIRRAFYP